MGCGVDMTCPTDAACGANAECDGNQVACPGNTTVWTDDPLVAGTTLIRDDHVLELQASIDAERTDVASPRRGPATNTACSVNAPGLYGFTAGVGVGSVVRNLHINEVADAVNTTEFNVSGDVEGPNPAAVADPLVNVGDLISVGNVNTLRTAINVVRSNCICDTFCSCNINCPCNNVLSCTCNVDIY